MTETNYRDFEAGKRDRLVGYYDKWYRYNRNDDGKAYDNGVQAAINSGKAKDECYIIPCVSSICMYSIKPKDNHIDGNDMALWMV